jgi:hypothetical protein
LLLGTAACAFDSSGVAAPGGSAPDDDTGEPSDTSSTTATPTTSSTTSVDTSDDVTTMPVETDGASGSSMLVLVDGPTYDFADVVLGAAATKELVLRNEGDGGAHAIAATLEGLPFAFVGGVYPGDGGTCTNVLAAASSCTIVVTAAPDRWGPDDGTLVLDYDDAVTGPGAVEIGLTTRGVGETVELLDNGDAEQGGAPPVGWTVPDGAGTEWQTTSTGAFEGALAIHPGGGTVTGAFRLRQPVATDPWAALIDGGGVTFHMRAQTRSAGDGDDPHGVWLRFFDEKADLIEELGSDDYAGAAWQTVDIVRVAPAGTRLVQVQLRCDRAWGELCSAYFDAVSLVASYP